MAVDNGMGTKKALVLGGLVVALTCAAIVAFGGGAADEASEDGPLVVEEEVLEVHPLVPGGAIRTASWHEDSDPSQPHADEPVHEGGTTSLIEASGLGKDNERDARAEKSLEEVVRRVNGLGVYVAPPEKEERGASGRKK